ncbi:3-oxoacyl-ACP synthase III family protein [Nonlabens sp. YIK11]|uniref:3-oxoacyl-ACP synthase III family protein n=1 Tax=Nonlabens sp. YIK11 TaxID=1453349 RepID=UPI0018D04919|nr:ketoacyl-ACP synthase III [Nonlabens sp. YIK11]
MDNLNDKYIIEKQGEKVLESTGIRYRHIAVNETAADLCYDAAKKLLEENNSDLDNIDFLVFVSQTPDYILPASATILQNRLGLKTTVAAFDVNMGCSGYVYGLSIISSLLASSINKNANALLLVGDTISKLCDPTDSSTYPLFGDAGSATLLGKSNSSDIIFDLNSDGSGCEAIKVEYGGFKQLSDGFQKTLYLNGMDVFSFGITKVPKAIKQFMEEQSVETSDFDYFIFHQANKFMNEKIRKKLKAEVEQVPYSLFDYANTSCATIPLTITSQLENISKKTKLFMSGFGVGLSWASAILELDANCVLNNSTYNG